MNVLLATQPRRPWWRRLLGAAPVRLVIDFVALAAILIGASAAAGWLMKALHLPHGAFFALYGLFGVPASLVAYILLVRWLEHRRASELIGHGVARELGWGLLVGAGLFTTTIGLIAAFGGYSIDGVEPVSVLGTPAAIGVVSGITEEIVARGVLFRILEEWLGTWAALVLSSAFFGVAHIGNPHATVWSALAIAAEAGTMLAAAYMVTRRLWLAIGIHAAWNFTQGGIFGVAVSGAEMKGVLRSTMHGPTWLSGGEFGAEASALAVVVCGTAATLLLLRAQRMGRFMAPSWVRRRRASLAEVATVDSRA
jgi:membrane protease YdiL (CAAX protease family)